MWADRASGKVWIKDSKSSNGTYINGLRLGNEKSESEPYELKKNDTLELGIDITNDERTSFVHRKISARVERISMMSLQAQNEGPMYSRGGLANGAANGYKTFGQANAGFNGNAASGYLPGSGFNTLKNAGPASAESLDVTLFGEIDASLEDLSLSHTRNSVGGLFMKSGITSSALLEQIVKNLVTEIHHAKVESAKIQSVSKLLEEISANQHESKILTERLPTLEEYKEQTDTLASELDLARQELANKDSHIAELEKLLKSQRTTNSKLQEDLRRKAAASNINFNEEEKNNKDPKSSLDDSNDCSNPNSCGNSNKDSSNDINDTSNDPDEVVGGSNDASSSSSHFDGSRLDSFRDSKSLSDETHHRKDTSHPKRPTSPDLYSDPIHQLSHPHEISVLNLNTPSNGTSAGISPGALPVSPAGVGAALSGDSSTHPDSDNLHKFGHTELVLRAPDESEDVSDEGNEDDAIRKASGSVIPRRSSSVPSSSPPNSPRNALTEIRSLPQSPRTLFNSTNIGGGVSGGAGSSLSTSTSSPSSLRSSSYFPHSAHHNHGLHNKTGPLSPNLQSIGVGANMLSLGPNTSVTRLVANGSSSSSSSSSTSAGNSSNKSKSIRESNRRSSNSSNSSNSSTHSRHSQSFSGSFRGLHNSHIGDEHALGGESDNDNQEKDVELHDVKSQLKKLTEELEAAKCEMELLRNRAATAERVAIERSRMRMDNETKSTDNLSLRSGSVDEKSIDLKNTEEGEAVSKGLGISGIEDKPSSSSSNETEKAGPESIGIQSQETLRPNEAIPGAPGTDLEKDVLRKDVSDEHSTQDGETRRLPQQASENPWIGTMAMSAGFAALGIFYFAWINTTGSGDG